MPILNPEQIFESMKGRVAEALRAQFPFEGAKRRLELVGVTFDDKAATSEDAHHIDNLDAQFKARTEGGTWGVPIRARLRLVDRETGHTIEEQTITLARLPKLTRRYSYIVDGQERQHDSVFRSKARPYHRIAANGAIQGRWNLARGRQFDINYEPKNTHLSMRIGTSNVPLYPVLRALGVSDASMENTWGRVVYDANRRTVKMDRDIDKLFKALALRMPDHSTTGTTDQKAARIKDYFTNETEVRAEAMRAAFGRPSTSVDGENLLASSKRLLDIQKGRLKEDPRPHELPDDRQALSEKYLATTEDFLVEAIQHAEGELRRKVQDRIDKPEMGIDDILSPNTYNKVILGKFAGAQRPDQTNPLQFLSGFMRTTIRGKEFGGVGSEKINLDPDKRINPTHLGFLDPIQTPESEDTGIALHLPLGIDIERAPSIPGSKSKYSSGQELKIQVYDRKVDAMVSASPADLEHAIVAYPDQVKWFGGKPSPVAAEVICYDEERKTSKRPWARVRYVLPSAKALFSFSANLVPFLQNNSGNRAMTGTKQQEQAVSLAKREEPLVQVKTDRPMTFEQLLGTFAAHFSPVAGIVAKVEPGAIHIAGDGKTTRVPIYNHYPLNGGRNALHAHPVVKAGDRVEKGALIADTNFTKNGTLAMGSNVRVAYIPWKGLNFEDGIVVSESAAKRMSSSHMHQLEITVYPGMVGGADGDRAKWVDYSTPDRTSSTRMNKLDGRGIVKEGTIVTEGDVLVAALSPTQPTAEDAIVSRIHKSLAKPFRDSSLVWDHEYRGKVVKVIVTEGLNRKKITVHVATEEPLVVGDKLTGRHGNKGIVSRIVPDHQMPHTADGAPVEMLLNPAGVPSRMNVGQVLETAASKVAEKTGKPYVVENFVPGVDYSEKVKKDLHAHGLSDTEELFDPETKRSVGQILTGKQYMFKLHHMVEKKMTGRSMLTGYTSSGDAPSGSGIPGGGQKMDMLTTYAMLAHGARNNLREAYTFKSDGDQDAVWAAVMTGRALPPPQPTRGMKNFLDYLRALGVNTEKKGDEYTIMPMTDAHLLGDQKRGIVGISNGEIKLPEKVAVARGVRTIEETGGLFDPKVTGGLKGQFWSHVRLAERMPNPLFESAIQVLTGTTKKQYDALVSDHLGADGKSGFHTIVDKLRSIDVDKELAREKARVGSLSRSELSTAVKRIRYLEALKEHKLSPLEAYTNQYLPVLPPSVRRISIGLDGTQMLDDRNGLYLAVGHANGALKEADPSTPPSDLQKARAHLYDSLRALKIEGMTQTAGKPRHLAGLMELLSGKVDGSGAPKNCFDDQTEILTQRGWVRFAELEKGEPVATVNLDTEAFEWQVPLDYVRQHYAGPMVHTKGRDIDLLVTPNHRHVVKTLQREGNSRTGVAARHWPREWRISTADQLLRQNKRRMMTAAARWSGIMHAYVFDGDDVRDARAFAWLVGLWAAEGWIGAGECAELAVSSASESLVDEVESALTRAGLSYTSYEYERSTKIGSKTHEYTEYRWRFESRALATWLRANIGEGSENKHFSGEVLAWPEGHLRELLRGFLDGDGCARSPGKNGATYKRRDSLAARGGLNTTSERMLDDLQHLCAKIGLRFTKRGSYQPRNKKHKRVFHGGLLGYRDTDVSFASVEVPYDGEVFCVSVPNTTVVVRRSGIPAVSGNSYFQNGVLSRRQDLSGRSTIVPEPALHLDEVGIPIPIATEMYRPFIVQELHREGMDAAAADKLVRTKKDDPHVLSALERAIEHRPVMLKRDPSLHKFSIMAFRPKLVDGKAIKIHPLVTGGFNADFDGDTMAMYVPVSPEAVDEAKGMMPSRNLFSPTHYGLMTVPGQDSLLGIYQATKWGNEVAHAPALTREKAVEMMERGKLKPTDVVVIDGKKTTPGRLALAQHLPASLQHDEKLLHDPAFRLDKGNLQGMLTRVGKEHEQAFPHVVDAWKDLGNKLSYLNGSSFGIDDFHDGKKFRDYVLDKYRAREAQLHKTPMSGPRRDREIVKLWTEAREELERHGKTRYNASDNRVWEWARAKARGNWEQFSQLVFGPMLVQDSSKKDVPVPITKSYGEGLSVSEYWASMHGARKGTLDRVQGTREPGAVTKDIINTVMGMHVTAEDCGATDGVKLSPKDPDALDRYIARQVKAGGEVIEAGQLLTPVLATKLANAGVEQVVLRSPLYCRMSNGICQHCYGHNERGRLHPIGANVGIIAGHALGEPITQLTMKTFHTGGASGSGASAVDSFQRVKQLFDLPEKLPDSATLAEVAGPIEKITHEPAIGYIVTIAGHEHRVVTGHLLPDMKVGHIVRRGDPISTGPINPHELLKHTKSVGRVRDYMTNELMAKDLYGGLGVRRRNVETVIKGMTNLSEVHEAPDTSPFMRGQLVPLSEVEAYNAEAATAGHETVKHAPRLRAMEQIPLAGVEDWLARLNYQRLKETYTEGAQQGWKSNIRAHPIPGLAHGAEFGLHPPQAIKPPPRKNGRP